MILRRNKLSSLFAASAACQILFLWIISVAVQVQEVQAHPYLYWQEEDPVVTCSSDGNLCTVNPRLDPNKLLEKFPSAMTGQEFNGVGIYEAELEEDLNLILCPMMRMLRRSGMLSRSWLHPQYSIPSIVSAMRRNLGFSPAKNTAMIGLAKGISAGQLTTLSTIPGFVNLHQLQNAVGVAHGSGYTFYSNSTSFDINGAFQDTRNALVKLQDEYGRLSLEDLKQIKRYIAIERGISVTIPSGLETGFVWSFCGGPKRGYVETLDVERFLLGYLPHMIDEPDFIRWDWYI